MFVSKRKSKTIILTLTGHSLCSCIPDNKEFHSPSVGKDSPFLYCVLSQIGEKVGPIEIRVNDRMSTIQVHLYLATLVSTGHETDPHHQGG